ncbi:MAG: glutathione S-transferase C-terminal domain-containing protein [Synechococcaceae cyanobacterium]|nr:glutathione S-transferase C-terminal domain-containing protein [Synechococcaceae cyanobacterium]
MRPPAALIRTARCLWQTEWRLLMSGLGPADAAGRYRRPAPAFGALPPLPQDAGEPDSHVLIVGRSCPWAHRAWLVHRLRRLETSISLLVVEPDPAAGRWRFAEPFEGCGTLAELYRLSGAVAGAPATVPALWSRRQRRILVNESARLIELLDSWPQEAATGPAIATLQPDERRGTITQWRSRLQETINDGVYRCGFARTQAAYDEAEAEFSASLDAAEQALLAEERNGPGWLCGGAEPSLADVLMFPTLIRLELVYAPLFGCSRRPLWQLPALWRWRARFHRLPQVAASCDGDAWRRDYHGALFPLRPSGIIPAGPDLATLVQASPPAAP